MKMLTWLMGALAVASLRAVPIEFNWQGLPQAPVAVARPYAGMVGDKLIMAGGSAFENGQKIYTSDIYAFDTASKTWSTLGKLPQGLAEGGALTVNFGTELEKDFRLLCFGGTDGVAASSKTFSINAEGKVEELPASPYGALTMTAVAPWNGGVAFVGGLLNGEMTNRVFTLKKEQGVWTWGELPAFPGLPRAQAVAATQNGDQKAVELVVFGGTGVSPSDKKQMALYDGYAYRKNFDGKYEWVKITDAPVSTIGATFSVIGDQHILLVGGYNGTLWDRVNRMLPLDVERQLALPAADFGWNKIVYAYHVVTGKWTEYATLPEAVLPRCGATAVVYQHSLGKLKKEPRMLLVGGEVKPRERTADAQLITFSRKGWAFSWVSWVVIGVYFIGMVCMAMVFILREKTADSYFRGGKSIPWYVAGMSIFATMLSSITFISIPTMTYISDWRYFPMVVCIFLLAPIAIYFYLPFFCRLNITSAYEYLEKRFNLAIRLFGSGVFNIFMVCRVAVVTLLPAIALNAVTGIDVNLCILICGIATIIYCCLGGLDAVIWSDFFQGIVLIGGAITVLIVLLMGTNGGIGGMFHPGGFVELASDASKLRILDFRFLLKEPVFWVVVIQGLVSNLSSYTSDQCVVQRYIACTNEKKAANSIWFNGALSVLASIVFYMIGTALYTHYVSHPEMMDVTMPKSDSVFPLFMAIELNPIIAGLVIAAIFAATISTLSANITSSSTAITTDFVLRFKPEMTGPQQVKCGRICVIVIGVLGVVAALMLAQVDNRSLFDAFQKFIAMLTAGLTALFFMGIFMPRVGGLPAVIGLIANYVVCYGLDLIPATSAWAVYKPHPFVYGGIGLVVCIVVAWVLSYALPNNRSTQGLTHFSKPTGEE